MRSLEVRVSMGTLVTWLGSVKSVIRHGMIFAFKREVLTANCRLQGQHLGTLPVGSR